jgi:hypothetical protein
MCSMPREPSARTVLEALATAWLSRSVPAMARPDETAKSKAQHRHPERTLAPTSRHHRSPHRGAGGSHFDHLSVELAQTRQSPVPQAAALCPPS